MKNNNSYHSLKNLRIFNSIYYKITKEQCDKRKGKERKEKSERKKEREKKERRTENSLPSETDEKQ